MVGGGREGPLQVTVGPEFFSQFLGPHIYTLTTGPSASSYYSIRPVIIINRPPRETVSLNQDVDI